MESKTRLSSYFTKQGNNTVNLVTSHNINTRLVHPIFMQNFMCIHLPKIVDDLNNHCVHQKGIHCI